MVQSRGYTTLYSGALAKAAEVSPDTIRHYEKIGVLPRASRTVSGYRIYSASAVQRVLVVQRALRIGFTLAELAEVLKARDAGGVPCQRVYELVQGKLGAIEADIEALKRTKRYLQKVLADWEERTQRAGPGQQSHLLYSLSEAVKNAGLTAKRFQRRNR
jgi:DNA-binding transcriptional MerR regulator